MSIIKVDSDEVELEPVTEPANVTEAMVPLAAQDENVTVSFISTSTFDMSIFGKAVL